MPVIQQEQGRKSVKGLPARWGVRAYRELHEALGSVIGEIPDRYRQLSSLLDEVTNAPLPVDATDAQLCILAQQCAEEVQRFVDTCTDDDKLKNRLEKLAHKRGLLPPDQKLFKDVVSRMKDSAWWRRNLRKTHGRIFEHAAIRLGLVSVKSGGYASDETVRRFLAQETRNNKTLAAVRMQNQSTEQIFGLDELAAKSTSNPKIKGKELMLRLAGCEAIANERGDVGLFITATCPAKYHSVMYRSGEINESYIGSTPRDAANYLQDNWENCRADVKRANIMPYGFRVAEPHHDGCPHWHMLLFVRADQMDQFIKIMSKHFLKEDYAEVAHDESIRVKFEKISKEKGSAVAYIAKYISKNIGDDYVTDHEDSDGIIKPEKDLISNKVIKPHHRVRAWASTWGIRQFQPIGQPPVTGWREIRRVPEEAIAGAPSFIKDAWRSAQRIEAVDIVTGKKKPVQVADYAGYIRAQGGVCMGRNYKIVIATRIEEIEGKYGIHQAAVPVGIFARGQAHLVYESTRYKWKRVQVKTPHVFTWSSVNNCTDEKEGREAFWAVDLPIQEFFTPNKDDMPKEWHFDFVHQGWHDEILEAAIIGAEYTRANTKWTVMRGEKNA